MSVVYFPIKVLELGENEFTITAAGSKMSDAIARTVEVLPYGKEFRTALNDRLSDTIVRTVDIPEEAIDGASNILVKLYPGKFSQLVETITTEVVLESENILTVQLASGPSNLIRVVIETYAPPALPPPDMADSGLGWHDVFGGSPQAGFLLGSYGADRQPGGTGPGADIIYGLAAAY